jgi:hypothetical protein
VLLYCKRKTGYSSNIVAGYDKQCANVLDRVYFILSLCHDGCKIEVDYRPNPAELAINISKTFKEFCASARRKCLRKSLLYQQLDSFRGGTITPSTRKNNK